jgi:hypothetical protein
MEELAWNRVSFRVKPMDGSCHSTGMNSVNQDDEIGSFPSFQQSRAFAAFFNDADILAFD